MDDELIYSNALEFRLWVCLVTMKNNYFFLYQFTEILSIFYSFSFSLVHDEIDTGTPKSSRYNISNLFLVLKSFYSR